VFLAQAARESGAVAASAFGAGFGGAVWALVAADKAEKMISDWSTRYEKTFPQAARHAVYFTTRPGPAAFEVK
ncbi:MAG: galactokinase, partial [Planctomycetaceae bacterium]